MLRAFYMDNMWSKKGNLTVKQVREGRPPCLNAHNGSENECIITNNTIAFVPNDGYDIPKDK